MSALPPPALQPAEPSPATPPAKDSAQLARGLGRKLVIAVLVAGLVFAALALYGDVQELRRTASVFAPSAFVIGLVLAAANYALRVVRWHYYLRHLGIRIPFVESALVFLSGFVMSVTPGKVGEVFKSLLLHESRGIPITRTAPIVIAERLTDLIALVMLTAAGALAFEHGVAVTVSSAIMVAGLVLVCAYPPLGRFALRICDRLPVIGRISGKLREAYESLLEMTRPGPLLLASGLAFVAWGLECASLYYVVRGFPGASLSWDAATFAYSASTLAGAVAMMPGGLGVTEIGMTALLQTLGGPTLTLSVATATTMLVRIATLWFAVLIGALALGAHRLMQRPEPAAPEAQQRPTG